jgi:hypothetical protein
MAYRPELNNGESSQQDQLQGQSVSVIDILLIQVKECMPYFLYISPAF